MSDKINLRERLDDFWVFPRLTKVKDKRDYSDDYFDFLREPDKRNTPTNLYIHVPFCDSRCLFCPYYKLYGVKRSGDCISKYVDSISKELAKYATSSYLRNKTIASVHFGGGNPLLMNLDNLKKLVKAIKSNFSIDVNDNWSLEGSISSIQEEEYIEGLLELGINRISFGIQTFKESIRKKLCIKTKIEQIYSGVEILRNAGLNEYCIDMMYNMPDQTMEDLYDDLEKVTALDPYHVDIYNMAVFPNTRLDRLLRMTDYFEIRPTNENQIRMFRAAHKWLKDHDYRQIITNTYSRKQLKPHVGDLLYLTNNNVIGIGVSSRGYIDGYAYKNVCSIEEYLAQIELDNFPADLAHKDSEEEHLDRAMVFFPILLSIERKRIPKWERYNSKIRKIIEMGLAKWESDALVLTEEGVLWSGNISAYFMGKNRWNTYITSFMTSLREKTNLYNEDYEGVNGVDCEEGTNVPI